MTGEFFCFFLSLFLEQGIVSNTTLKVLWGRYAFWVPGETEELEL